MEATSAAEKLEAIQVHLATEGNVVVVATYTRATYYNHKHRDSFKVAAGSLYVRRGKAWDCIDYNALRFGRYTKGN